MCTTEIAPYLFCLLPPLAPITTHLLLFWLSCDWVVEVLALALGTGEICEDGKIRKKKKNKMRMSEKVFMMAPPQNLGRQK